MRLNGRPHKSVEDFGNSIAQAAAPGLIDLNHFLTDLIDTNRDWIAQDIGSYVKQFSYWFRNGGWDKIKTDIEDAAHAVSDVVKELGGWESAGKKALVAIGLLYAAPVLAGLVSLTTAVLGIATAFSKVETAADAAQIARQFASGTGGPIRTNPSMLLNSAGVAYEAYQAYQNGAVPPTEAETDKFLGHIPGYTRFSHWWNRMSGAEAAPLEQPVQAAALQAAQKYGLDPDHYIALLRAEHGGTRNVSPAGAFGPSQLMPDTARGLGLPASIDAPGYSWQQNLDGGARYYRQLLNRYQGDYVAADAAYNAGPYSKSVRQFAQTHDPSVLPHETQNYISSIARMSGFKSGPPVSLPSTGNGSDGANGTPANFNVGIAVHAPPGTKVQVTDAPPGANIRPQVQTQRAMPPEITATGS